MENYMVWVWLGVFLFTILIEALSQDLIAIWFSLGSLISLVLSAVPNLAWYIELIVFALVSLFVMFLTRPFAKRLLLNATRYTNIDEYVGKRVSVIKEISKYENGEIKINGIIYQACLLEEEYDPIKANEIVEIVNFKGNKVIVRRLG